MTIREYIDSQDESIRPRLNAVYDTIRAAIPEAEERLSWGMPTFWKGVTSSTSLRRKTTSVCTPAQRRWRFLRRS